MSIVGRSFGAALLSNVAIADWFAARQLPARYRIIAISPSSTVLEAVSIGPAHCPDFTAQRIVVAPGWSPLRPNIDFITLVSPRLRGKATAVGVNFGSLDHLLPGPNDAPKRFPDLDLWIIDGRIDLATPIGPMTAAGQQDGARQVVATGSYQLGKTLPAASLDGALTVAGGSITVPFPAIRNQTRRFAL